MADKEDLEEMKRTIEWLASRVPLREVWSKRIHDAFKLFWNSDDVKKVSIIHNRRGPMGGVSSQIELLVHDAEGELNRVIINVYCDETTNADLPREEDM